MKKFIIRIVLFTLFFISLDKTLLYFREKSAHLEVDNRLEKIINGEIAADILVFGSSRGARSVIARQISDSLNRSAYNLAFPGSDITFHSFLLELLLKNKSNQIPEKIILVVDDADELQKSKSLKFRLDRMYPLVKYKVIRDELVKRKEKKPFVNELLVSHQLNKSNFLLKQKKFTKNDSIMSCGSMPISHQKKTFDKKFGKVPYNYDVKSELIQKINALNDFINLCEKNDIQLIVALPPNFRVISNGFENRMKHFVRNKGVVWKYDQNKPDYSDPDNFFDNAHLQKKGAIIYTADLIAYLKASR
ncbi:MAG: hypothetical protein RL108_453 [Bacteroidota bacterium]|jgi:hypothetical protein